MGTLLPMPIPSADPLDPARSPRPDQSPPEDERGARRRCWNLETLSGGITEVSGPGPTAGFTAAALLLHEAQERGEPAAWVMTGDSVVHAPDLHEWGTDLQALPFIRVRGAIAGARAAEHLLRSGAFGLVVLDLGVGISVERGTGTSARPATLPSAVQVRLAALCRRHRTALLLLARKPEGAPPVASMAILRAEGTVRRIGFDQFTVQLRVRKDKRQGAGWTYEEVLRGPDGLC